MLDNNIPVIISYDRNFSFTENVRDTIYDASLGTIYFYLILEQIDKTQKEVANDILEPLKLYNLEDGNIVYNNTSINSHYMVVCEDIHFSDDVLNSTDISNSRLLKVSSWGNEYYIDFDEYCEQVNRLTKWYNAGPIVQGLGKLIRNYTYNILNIEVS